MKRVLFILLMALFIIPISSAQQRTKLYDGVYIVSYGNTTVIENDNTQQTIQITVSQTKNSLGEKVYEIACGNSRSKKVLKSGLKVAIGAALKSAGAGWFASWAVSEAVDFIYDSVCDYYSD